MKRSAGSRWRRRRWCVPLAAVVLAAVAAGPAGATGPSGACGPQAGDAPAHVASVSDDLDVVLDDGRTLRLAGLDVPPPTASDAAHASAVRQALAAWIGGGSIMVRTLAALPDRWGRVPALLMRSEAPEPSAARALIAAGLARAAPDAAIRPCFHDLLQAEAEARVARLGLWSDPREAVLRADDRGALSEQSGGFAIVEGRLAVHASRTGTLYLTLGRDRWGFAAVLTRRDAERLAKAGLDVTDYAGTPVRLRGTLDDRFGPRLRLTDPDQFESLEPGALDDPPAAGR